MYLDIKLSILLHLIVDTFCFLFNLLKKIDGRNAWEGLGGIGRWVMAMAKIKMEQKIICYAKIKTKRIS